MNALDRHVALVGFMGAGKSTLGAETAERLGRRFVDVDAEIERHTNASIADLFASRGEPAFRAMEQRLACEALDATEPSVIALGGGAVLSQLTRRKLRERALAVLVEVSPEAAWERARGGGRPLAASEEQFRALYVERGPLYEEVADARAAVFDDIVLAAAGIRLQAGSYADLADHVDGAAEVLVDERVLELHPPQLEVPVHALPAGESAKTIAVCERLWQQLRLERGGTLVAVGGGSTTDVGGFVAAAYLRGIPWIAVPTSLVGQVDAAIGGKTAIDLPQGKNLVGAFHWPRRTVIDSGLLETLPERERRNGLAEVVKTGLLAGERFWELPEPEMVRACAAFKAAVCLRDPLDQADRAMLNIGHTFAHALEAAADFKLAHGEAVALGLVAALELSGLRDEAREVERVLRPSRPAVDPERAWAALLRDKKSAEGRVRLVLLEEPGKPLTGVELPPEDVRHALDGLIA
jgi:3-dehydroquinate synthetase/shikimate kinase